MTPWSSEISRLLFLLLLALLIGLLSGKLVLSLSIAVLIYLGWHLYNIRRFSDWLDEGDIEIAPPQSKGIWEEIFNTLYRQGKKQRLKRRRLQRRLEHLEESTTAMPDATIILGRKGVIEWGNEAAMKLLGIKEADISQRIANIVRNPRFVDYLNSGNYSQPLEMHSPVKANLALQIRIIPYGRSRRLLLARDVSRLKQLEQMRRDFISNFSHELRTPLTVLRGYLESMQTDHALEQDWGESLEIMFTQTERMQKINDDLLLLSRLENTPTPSQEEEVDVTSLLNTIITDARVLSGDRAHKLSLESDEGLRLRGNTQELYSAFSNLVFNAVHYTPPGSEIQLHWFEDDKGAHLSISDNGPGIPALHLPRLTERFYRVDAGRSREEGGTGLGLAIVKHVLERHQAKLRIKSQLGKGTTFRCDFRTSSILRD